MLKITNTLTGQQEPLKTLKPNEVLLYVCGITPYDVPHLGHGRVYVTFDLLYRLLQFLGYNVIYCRNFTDIDDKLLDKAQKEFGDRSAYKPIADRYILSFKQAMNDLNCLAPTYQPRVTENIPIIIDFIDNLIKKGHAYQANGDVYFSIDTMQTYPQLSKQKLEDLQTGSRVDIDPQKKNPLDFALWKSEPEGTFWQSPWGYGRPGWHIECSALAKKFLGEQIDIHGGGMDLISPHHDNELAQTESVTEKPFALQWMHNAFVRIDQEKMSKSLGNFFTLADVFATHDPMVVRYYYLTHHYRSPLDFDNEDLQGARKAYEKLIKLFNIAACNEPLEHTTIKENKHVQKMLSYLCDDLNSQGALGYVFAHSDALQQDEASLCAVKQFIELVFGLTLMPLPEQSIPMTPEIQELIAKREQARKQKDWKAADALRDQLKALGVDVQDKKLS